VEKEKPSLIRVDTSGDFQSAVGHAADILLDGGLVAFPTESFYGIAVDVRNEGAIKRLFSAKGRSAGSPVLILIGSLESLDPYVEQIPPVALRLIEKFWPGGLTLVFRASSKVSPLLTGGTQKIGIRLSSHPVATALARTIDAPISGTSANISGLPGCRNAQEVLESLGSGVDLILDGGETAGKVGSTVLDVTEQPPRILREGIISREQLKACSFDIS
jgi:L-threonylcarbamoyladenylate synthase